MLSTSSFSVVYCDLRRKSPRIFQWELFPRSHYILTNHGQIEYLKDQTTGEIVWPPDAQLGCHPLPWSYAVVAVEEKEVRIFVLFRYYPSEVSGSIPIAQGQVPTKHEAQTVLHTGGAHSRTSMCRIDTAALIEYKIDMLTPFIASIAY